MKNSIIKVVLYLGLTLLLPSCIDSDNAPMNNDLTDTESWIKTTKIQLDIASLRDPKITLTKKDNYNEDGQKINSTSTNSSNVYMFAYNAEGLLSERNFEYSDGTKLQTIYTYNDNQQLISATKALDDSNIIDNVEYTYDEDGRVSTMITTNEEPTPSSITKIEAVQK